MSGYWHQGKQLVGDDDEPHPLDADGWRRDLHFTLRCLCGHLKDEHRHDLTASSPCYRGGCGCQHLRPDARIFYEHRTVTEPIEGTS